MNFLTSGFSECGPKSINEDCIGIWQLQNGGIGVAVADGLGGMGGGDRASQTAIDHFGKTIIEREIDQAGLVDLSKNIHANIRSLQDIGADDKTMATTLTGAVFCDQSVIGVHCGDSRAAIARGPGILRLTKDHSEVQRLLDSGKISKSEYLNYPRRNILDSALGAHKTPKIDSFSFHLSVGDKLFFTTDGVHQKVYLREVRAIAEKSPDPAVFVEKIKELVNDRKAEDNFSMVAVFVEE